MSIKNSFPELCFNDKAQCPHPWVRGQRFDPNLSLVDKHENMAHE